MPSVTINTIEYEVYADVDAADDYMNGMINAATWSALTTDTKARGLVGATRLLDRQKWMGSRTVDGQDLAFPRSGLIDCEGTTVDEDEVPQSVIDASIILAMDLASGSEAETAATTENKAKRLKAGSVEIENFKSDPLQSGRFTLAVMELIGCFLAGSSPTLTGVATGTDGCEADLNFGFTGYGF